MFCPAERWSLLVFLRKIGWMNGDVRCEMRDVRCTDSCMALFIWTHVCECVLILLCCVSHLLLSSSLIPTRYFSPSTTVQPDGIKSAVSSTHLGPSGRGSTSPFPHARCNTVDLRGSANTFGQRLGPEGAGLSGARAAALGRRRRRSARAKACGVDEESGWSDGWRMETSPMSIGGGWTANGNLGLGLLRTGSLGSCLLGSDAVHSAWKAWNLGPLKGSRVRGHGRGRN